jgi:ABC-2 type transport system ATP-binding protein
MIEVRGLTKYYGKLAALRSISFDATAGEVLGILGPNAAGKTTTMRILAGYTPPSAGQARVAGYDVAKAPQDVRRHIGYLPEEVALYGEMSVRAYLDFMAGLHGMRRRKARLDEVMEMCQLTGMASRPAGKLSRGYRQRVGLAQALLHNPPVLILDEPTAGLDPAQIIEVRDLIRSLGKAHTVILSTHILSEVEHICGRVMILNEGQIVAEDSRQQLRARLKGSERIYIEVAGATPAEVESELRAIGGVSEVRARAGDAYQVICALGNDARADIAARVVKRGWQLLELRPEGLSLEEVFLKLTQEERPPDNGAGLPHA